MKIQNSNRVVSQMGGAVVVHKKLVDYGIPQLIVECLGKRAEQAKYGYDDMMLNWILTVFCHGYRMVRVSDTKEDLQQIPGLNLCSHDTIGRMFKSLATEIETEQTINPKNPARGIKEFHKVENEKLNNLLIKVSKKVGLLKRNTSYTLDMDASPVETEVHDSSMTYKGHRGYMPMVCMIGKAVVYVSQRGGNANPMYKQLDCLKRSIRLLKKHGIKVGTVRIDGAGYSHEILEYLKKEKIKFVIGAAWSVRTHNMAMQSRNWTKEKFITSKHSWDAQMGSFPFNMAHHNDGYRMVVIRVKMEQRNGQERFGKTKWVYKNGYYYKFLITNDETSTPHDLFQLYHQRGAIEKNFDVLKNDFGWKIQPFSKMNENLVYMLMCSIANNVYEALLDKLKDKVKVLNGKMRLGSFRKAFLRAAFTIINDICTIHSKNIDFAKI